MATRIHVEWMTSVPTTPEGGSDYDSAEWAFKEFAGDAIKKARAFAKATAKRNPFGQAWIKLERSSEDEPKFDWQWERDYSADEIVEAA